MTSSKRVSNRDVLDSNSKVLESHALLDTKLDIIMSNLSINTTETVSKENKTSTKVSSKNDSVSSTTYKVDELVNTKVDEMGALVVRHPAKFVAGVGYDGSENQDKMNLVFPAYISNKEAYKELNMIGKQSGGRLVNASKLQASGRYSKVPALSYNGSVPQDVIDLFNGLGCKIEGI